MSACTAWRYFYTTSNCLVSLSLVALNADRLCSLTWPFWARQHLNERTTRFVIIGIISYALPINLPVLISYGVSRSLTSLTGVACILSTAFKDWYYIAAPFVLSIGGMSGPAIVLLVLIVLVLRKVLADSAYWIYSTYCTKRQIKYSMSRCFRLIGEWALVESDPTEN